MIGLTPEEAARRLGEAGIAYTIKRAKPRRRVLGSTEPRVMRVRRSGGSLELLVGEFRVFGGAEPYNAEPYKKDYED